MGLLTQNFPVAKEVTQLRFAFVNLFLIGSAESWVLVDAGLWGAAGTIIRTAEKIFGKGSRPAAIILTHGHFDHRGALPALLRHWNPLVYAHEDEIPFLTGQADYPQADPAASAGLMARASFLYPRRAVDLRPHIRNLPPEGEVPALPGWRWLHTPGHCPGHISLFRAEDRLCWREMLL